MHWVWVLLVLLYVLITHHLHQFKSLKKLKITVLVMEPVLSIKAMIELASICSANVVVCIIKAIDIIRNTSIRLLVCVKVYVGVRWSVDSECLNVYISASGFKINKIFSGYFDPEKIFLDNENKYFSG